MNDPCRLKHLMIEQVLFYFISTKVLRKNVKKWPYAICMCLENAMKEASFLHCMKSDVGMVKHYKYIYYLYLDFPKACLI